MKTTKTTTAGLASFSPALTLAEITQNFIRKQEKAKNGSNDYLRDFCKIAEMISANYRSFELNTFLQLSRSMDTPAAFLAAYFHDWVSELQSSGRLTCVHGAYDFPTYYFK